MKTLANHTIYYDSECPMCALYTGAMVKHGLLDEQGRASYSEAACAFHPQLDAKRARNEIALVNHETNEVKYGLDSLFTVIAARYGWLEPLFRWGVFRSVMLRLYRFISYNRKVIAPAQRFETPGSCTPDMSLKYRWAYIAFTWVVTSLTLFHYSDLMYPVVPSTSSMREFAICGGQVLFQAVIVGLMRKDRLMHYIGNMMTISLSGALALLPALVVGQWFPLVPEVYVGYFLGIAGLMLLEHMRRVKLLGLHWAVTAGWVTYRILVLGIILYFVA